MAMPPFRAEHIGSLLRPEKLLKARAALEGDQYRTVSGSTLYAELKEIEDEAIRDAVKLQENAGLQSITDGEFRRRSWYQDFLLALGGTSITFVDANKTISAAMPFCRSSCASIRSERGRCSCRFSIQREAKSRSST